MATVHSHCSHHLLHRSTNQPRSRPRSRHSDQIIISSSARSEPHHNLSGRTLRAAVIGGGPAGSSAAEALAAGGIETFLIERDPTGSKPCGGAIPLCMLDEFSIPLSLVDRKVTRVNIISPSNLTVDFGRSLGSREFIAMLRREVLDSYLRSRAQSHGAELIPGLFTGLEIPTASSAPYVVHYNINGSKRSLCADVVIGADGAHSRVAKAISAGNYDYALAFQERIKLPDEKMRRYENLAEMYVGSDISPDFYGWVFPKCDHVAVGTGTARARGEIKRVYNRGIRERVREKISGGRVIKVEAHPIPAHPRPRRVRGRVALVGDSAGYVTKCAGEGIYFAAKSGRMCGEGVVRASGCGTRMIDEGDLRREYLERWDGEYRMMFRFLDGLERVFYGRDEGWEALVEMCGDEYVQRMTFESYLYKKMAVGDWWSDVKMGWRTLGSLVRARIIGREIDRLNGLREKLVM